MSDVSYRSYRDRHSTVRFEGDVVLRTFDDEGAAWFEAAADAGLLHDLSDAGLIVGHTVRSRDPLVLESPRFDAVTYPYEWTPSMLRDAALVTLDIATRSWDAGFHLRDASAFNIVFHRGRPVLVDLGSFRPGHTGYFLAYGQFCDHFLNPLALLDASGVSPRSAWSSLEGISAGETKGIAGLKAMRPKYLKHIWARAKLEQRSGSTAASERRSVRDDYSLPPKAVRGIFESLGDTIRSVDLKTAGVWEHYEADNSYDRETAKIKSEFVAAAAATHSGEAAIDVGANTGQYSALLAPYFDSVIAIEPDEAAADVLYNRVKNGNWLRMSSRW